VVFTQKYERQKLLSSAGMRVAMRQRSTLNRELDRRLKCAGKVSQDVKAARLYFVPQNGPRVNAGMNVLKTR
jgi:hypothetical protein